MQSQPLSPLPAPQPRAGGRGLLATPGEAGGWGRAETELVLAHRGCGGGGHYPGDRAGRLDQSPQTCHSPERIFQVEKATGLVEWGRAVGGPSVPGRLRREAVGI